MKNKSDKHAAAALRVLTGIHRELVAIHREREKRARQQKLFGRAFLLQLENTRMVSPEVIAAIRKAL